MVFDLFTASRPKRTRMGADIRKDLYRRQRGRCLYCGSRQRMDLMDIDHKVPLARGGSNQRNNLQLLCRTCNLRKGARTDREFRRAHRDAGVPQTQAAPSRTIRQSAFSGAGKPARATGQKNRRTVRNGNPRHGWLEF